MRFTTLFFENLFSISTFNSSSSLLPTTVSGFGSSTISDGSGTIVEGLGEMGSGLESSFLTTAGSSISSTGSSVSSNSFDAYHQTKQQLNLTQAYMESLNQEELETLIAKLEVKNTEFFCENQDKPIQKIKTNN